MTRFQACKSRFGRGLPILFSLLFAMLIASGCTRKEEESVKAEPVDYAALIRSTNKLILSEMTINKMASIDDLKFDEAKGSRQQLNAVLNWFKIGTRKGAYSYNTYLRAFIDLNELKLSDVEVDTVAKVMRIHLPEIKTEFIGRDVQLREDHYRVTGLRTQINLEERARVKEAMNASLKREVEERAGFKERLKASAKGKAVAYFTAFAEGNGFRAEIDIKD
ncbi:MAG: DUF4230 domain-containing protein [Muribaculaceae bacterium]|nr:DUF4230 domain-containing protein [Muribaculaceae bacterium]